ncbi:MAG: LysM peptidoglycan-binding domain-containing protein [Campylobacteraceae bacterium]|nr:LysM peptidoglycan-binding domain-containing protein [Campylobacteraceae bacterium]MBT4030302.1 LysM peptidoglycan-binding domain-containing protein [Campylobacteraceae bacterium]MBT4572892.1 LysM peptidoglycan-binding domain-containing protein [Campylobacteraceae bacterium]MBT5323698.1 LysM peptidoglycan-binding domain-containing protein [Campylobacteraceae bacterium]MBT5982280.1 LysM peptidoglycan-binding domain-containing protein [Campylobacteraceae bacterium]
MSRLIFSILLLSTISFASLVNSGFIYSDLKILEDLDLDRSFITDPKLQKTYQRIINNNQKRYAKHLNDAHLFVPKIKQILKENDIPPAFLYLVMAESNFSLNAKSYKKALGLWQFMPKTGKIFGLKQDEYVDERMDIIKSTRAAVSYLKSLKKRFGKWYLAAIAYNCGEGRVYEALTRSTLDMYLEDNKKTKQTKEFRKIISLYQKKKLPFNKLYKVYKEVRKYNYTPGIKELLHFQKGLRRQYLPGESQEYIRKIISLGLMNNREFLINGDNAHLLNRGISEPIITVQIKGGVLLEDVGKLVGMSYDNIHGLNKHIKQGLISPEYETYDIYLPYSVLSRFQANIENIKDAKYAMHKVKSGDSLYQIAKKYKINYKLIKKFNKLSSNVLSINQKLIIPVAASFAPKNDEIYIIKSGDTLSAIAKIYKIKLSKLMKDNKISSSLINIGDKIVISYE